MVDSFERPGRTQFFETERSTYEKQKFLQSIEEFSQSSQRVAAAREVKHFVFNRPDIIPQPGLDLSGFRSLGYDNSRGQSRQVTALQQKNEEYLGQIKTLETELRRYAEIPAAAALYEELRANALRFQQLFDVLAEQRISGDQLVLLKTELARLQEENATFADRIAALQKKKSQYKQQLEQGSSRVASSFGENEVVKEVEEKNAMLAVANRELISKLKNSEKDAKEMQKQVKNLEQQLTAVKLHYTHHRAAHNTYEKAAPAEERQPPEEAASPPAGVSPKSPRSARSVRAQRSPVRSAKSPRLRKSPKVRRKLTRARVPRGPQSPGRVFRAKSPIQVQRSNSPIRLQRSKSPVLQWRTYVPKVTVTVKRTNAFAAARSLSPILPKICQRCLKHHRKSWAGLIESRKLYPA